MNNKRKLDSPGGLKQGYSIRRINKNNLSKDYYENQKQSYPNGMIPFFSLLILLIITLGLTLGITPDIKHGGAEYRANEWQNIIFYVTGAIECIIALWALGRAGLFSTARFAFFKFGKVIKWDVLKQKIKFKVIYSAIDDVKTIDDWNNYLNARKYFTKKWFYISIGFYSSLFLISTIIMLSIDLS